MNYGIKISKQGYNIINLNEERSELHSEKRALPHLLSALALPYLLGAKTQVQRYQMVASTLERRNPLATFESLHEASTLFEDLNTVARYIEKCGQKNELHSLWLDVRNHIRHDVREEYDKEDSIRKNRRANRLKLNPKLQTNIGFDMHSIKVGETLIEIQQINSYLSWAEGIITEILSKAKKEGYLK